jgi:uncharacterized YccA/Bax inhibitor family protein
MRTSNPILNEQVFTDFEQAQTRMTVMGAVNKTAVLLALLVGAAAWTWYLVASGGNAKPWFFTGMIGGLVVALVLYFKPALAMILAPVYAILEGLAIGAISAMFESQYSGIVIHAVGLTIGTLICLLIAYRTGIIRATEKFKLGVVAATGAVFLVYMVDIIMGFFGASIPMIHSSGTLGIGLSVVIVVIAALNLVLDFDFFEAGQRNGAPKYMEWYAAFGLIVTLVWLYLEILRLLSKLKSR